MELTELLNHIKVIQVAGNVQRKDVSGIEHDSRKVKKNSVFVAIKGYKTDGHLFVMDAINKGAVAVVVAEDNNIPDEIFIHADIAKIVVHNTRIALAELSKGFYKDPTSKLKLVGITGTNGKTTTAFIIKNIFEMAGIKTGLIGTIANYIGSEKIDAKLTTPESNELNDFFLQMLNNGCKNAVMEVSSHSLVLNRVYGLNFSGAVFTNITSDHLDFHLTFENYLNSKKILFDILPSNSVAVVNADDDSSKYIVSDSKAKILTYGRNEISDYVISSIRYDLNGTNFTITNSGKSFEVKTKLIGEFNAYNCTAAFAIADSFGIDKEKIISGIETTPFVPGRFEVIGTGIKKAIVDYSHTADSLEKAILALRQIIGNERQLVTVFGCGGDRDKTKRPVMGKVATELSDLVIITSDNPRTENPNQIINDIKQGVVKNNFIVIENRYEAIKYAIKKSKEDAAILIAGKGHETYQEINGVRDHFSDQEIAREFLS
ncbi:UDP-N-acetylmuramyl tripeptide synthase [Ignavibacterium album JCM 16511]|uniref:UDP-N-acetylmuramoyl-L-alanyl-D-glutamate--2,6-diaminopimelate ligase n=1 Tax=Ignavibacterium album (strain DSM 19864 / JCM 16511 / NBRC 101810 / Mat9-16) TaxID=945713 RepID=I0ALQ7_IGNAJ|nr:UDP-N-acetylmuramoyl-L-alanyl-D-glutamate--2,6-diaminopimelate ligase [Ignavibacterium album]AFH49914.1 UDP-N-acetylmuramyl tripeptide synthase [Ignavibacterium album JCM 16511]